MENWIIIRSVLCSEGKQIDIFFVCCCSKFDEVLARFCELRPHSCAKKILEHDFNTSVYTHSHLFDVFCETILFENDMSWIEEGTIVWHEKKVLSRTWYWEVLISSLCTITNSQSCEKMTFQNYGIYLVLSSSRRINVGDALEERLSDWESYFISNFAKYIGWLFTTSLNPPTESLESCWK